MVGWGAALVVSRTGTAVLLAEGREKQIHVCRQVLIGVFADLVQPITLFFTLPAASD